MNRYTGDECSVCKVTFRDSDDVVVCPVCGTPYHRACYSVESGCVNKEWHGNTTYEQEKAKKREETAKKCEDTSELRCPKCSAKNPPYGLFCQVCGTSLREKYNETNEGYQYYQTPPPITPNPFTTPYGGLSPDEEIDGVSAKELAVFVGNNSFYYLPRMKEIQKEEKTASWNWSAFLFHFMYFFYRKMYALGALIMSMYIVSAVPGVIFEFKRMAYSSIDFLPAELQALGRIANICSFLFWGIQALCGLFANYLYTQKTFKTISKIKKKGYNENSAEYVNELSKKGRTNRRIIGVILGLYIVLNIFLVQFFFI